MFASFNDGIRQRGSATLCDRKGTLLQPPAGAPTACTGKPVSRVQARENFPRRASHARFISPGSVVRAAKSPAHRQISPMHSLFQCLLKPAPGPAAIFLIRLAVGLIFFTQGMLKFTDPNMGVARFTRFGFSHPYFTAHFVGAFEIVCGLLVLVGLWTRAASVPLLVVIATAIVTTKLPELSRPAQGFWYMVSDARADFAMLCSLLFLILAGGGAWALDARRGTSR